LEQNPGALSAAAVRLIAQQRPAQAASVLLAFLPSAEDTNVLDEVRAALGAVAHVDGKPDPALAAALEDPLPLRRAVAVEALCQPGMEPPAAVRKLLDDPKPSVRLRAALALARRHDARAVSLLISLLAELPLEQARLAEEFLSDLAGEQAPRAALAADEGARRRCRDAWAAWWSASEGTGLLDELRKRTLAEDSRVKGLALIQRLGHEEFAVREKAAREIRAMGTMVIPLLRQAQHDPDVEVRRRAEALISVLERDPSLPLSPVTARLIALRKPPGAAEAVLAFLPYTVDDSILVDLQRTLNAVAAPNGKAEPAVVRALADPIPVRRAAAAEALCEARAGEHLGAVRKFLSDPDPAVRLKVALALAGSGEREAVPVLIRLVGELRGPEVAEAEDYLLRLSGDRPPPGLPSGEGDARRKRGELWAAWWAANGGRCALVARQPAELAERQRGYTLLVLAQNNQVQEVGPDGKVRWEVKDLMGPQDAVVVGRDRVLIAEHNGHRVTERTLQGEVIWQKPIANGWPLGVQRLRNGNTFITCRSQLLEVDRSGRELYTISRPGNDVVAARKLRDGKIVCVSSQRTVSWLDAEGKELKSFVLPIVMTMGVEIHDNGHVLACVSWLNKLTEYDAEGKAVWEATVSQPWAAHRLPGGNTLVSLQQWPAKVIEVDRDGRTVGELSVPSQVVRLHRR
jgi:HEAT repeat protein